MIIVSFMIWKQVNTAAPQLKGYRNEVKARLAQALQNKRKYQNDVKVGKRKGKNWYM